MKFKKILARIDPKTKKTHAAAKKCCGWEKTAMYGYDTFYFFNS